MVAKGPVGKQRGEAREGFSEVATLKRRLGPECEVIKELLGWGVQRYRGSKE